MKRNQIIYQTILNNFIKARQNYLKREILKWIYMKAITIKTLNFIKEYGIIFKVCITKI